MTTHEAITYCQTIRREMEEGTARDHPEPTPGREALNTYYDHACRADPCRLHITFWATFNAVSHAWRRVARRNH